MKIAKREIKEEAIGEYVFASRIVARSDEPREAVVRTKAEYAKRERRAA